MKKEKIIATILIVVALLAGVFYKFGLSSKMGQSKSNDDLVQIVQNQDSKKFLQKFDNETTKSPLSDIGAKSILKDWNQNSTVDISKISSTLRKNGRVPGAQENYHIKYIETRKFVLFKREKLSTMTSKLIVPSKLKKASITVDGKKVSYSNLTTNNLFPGVYNFKIKLGKATSTQKVTVLGDGRSSTLVVPKQDKVESSTKEETQKSDDTNTKNNQNQVQEQTPKDDTSANDASRDPEYKEPSMVNASDLEGNWKLFDAKNNDLGMMPETITFTDGNITAMYAHNIQTSTPIDSVQYSEEDDTDYFTGSDSPNPFAAKLVKMTVNGKERVVLEHLDQGVYGWYLRQ